MVAVRMAAADVTAGVAGVRTSSTAHLKGLERYGDPHE
jgi:hypothetical protein